MSQRLFDTTDSWDLSQAVDSQVARASHEPLPIKDGVTHNSTIIMPCAGGVEDDGAGAETLSFRRDECRAELEGTGCDASIKPVRLWKPLTEQLAMSRYGLQPRNVTDCGSPNTDGVEYEIGRQLGEGGMGTVYQARQVSINRTVALKVIKTSVKTSERIAETIVAEAVITGDLEHPGIVPIYDLGIKPDGEVFYAMKEVRGQSWKAVIDQNLEAANVEVLLRVADAIAFAHARGVVHRDLKPDNIMIGEFGEVLVMDWGLALPTAAFSKTGIPFSGGVAGTASYMAPEMAIGDVSQIGPASDIYLLGGLLFRLLTGKAPHPGRHAFECLQAAESNEFVAVDRDDELMSIAYRAMSAEPGDRYGSVKEFQAAIREYQSHAESLRLTDIAEAEVSQAKQQPEYRRFEESIVTFRNAQRLWSDNLRARSGLNDAQQTYASEAHRRGDLDLATQQLDAECPAHSQLLATIRAAIRDRNAQQFRTRRWKWFAKGLAVSVLLVASVSGIVIHRSWRQEQAAHAEALQRFQEAQAAIERLTGISQDLEYFPRLQIVRLNLLEMAAKYYRELNEQRSGDPDMQLASAESMLRLGDVRLLLGEYESARLAFTAASELAAPLRLPPHPADRRQSAEMVRLKCCAKLAACLRTQGKLKDADACLEVILGAATTPETPALLAAFGNVVMERAQLHRQRGQFVEAAESIVRAQSFIERAAVNATGELAGHRRVSLALSYDQLALVEEQAGQLDRAEQSVKRAIALWEKRADDDRDLPARLEGRASSQTLLCRIQLGLGHDAELAARDAITTYETLEAARPDVPRYQYNLAIESSNLADVLLQSGDIANARALSIEATQRSVRLVNQYPEDVDFADADATARSVLGEVLRDQGDVALAKEKLDEAIEHFERQLAEYQDVPAYRERLAECLLVRGQVADFASLLDESRDFFTRGLAVLESVSVSPGKLTPSAHRADLAAWLHLHLADDAYTRGETPLSQTHYQAALRLREALSETPRLSHHFGWLLSYGLSPESRQPQRAVALLKRATSNAPTNGNYWFDLAVAQSQAGQWDEAGQSLERAKKCRGVERGQWQLIQSLIERHHGRTAQAEDLLRQGRERIQQVSPGNPRLRRLSRLVRLHD